MQKNRPQKFRVFRFVTRYCAIRVPLLATEEEETEEEEEAREERKDESRGEKPKETLRYTMFFLRSFFRSKVCLLFFLCAMMMILTITFVPKLTRRLGILTEEEQEDGRRDEVHRGKLPRLEEDKDNNNNKINKCNHRNSNNRHRENERG